MTVRAFVLMPFIWTRLDIDLNLFKNYTKESEHCVHHSMSLTGFWYISAIMIMAIAFQFVMKMLKKTVLAFTMHIL